MYFVSKSCPFIEGFEINDLSTRLCDNDTTITLSYFSITTYGKTWYEKNFKAYIIDEQKRKNYEDIICDLFKRKLPEWDAFNVLFLRGVNNEIKDKLKLIHENSTTYKSLFKNINNEGISNACIYLEPWIDTLMLTTELRKYVMFTQWLIPVKNISRIPLLNYKKYFSGRKEKYELQKQEKI